MRRCRPRNLPGVRSAQPRYGAHRRSLNESATVVLNGNSNPAEGEKIVPITRLPRWAVPLALLLLAGSPAAFAHATLVRSTPGDRAIVHSHAIDVALEYNSRIEASRCTVTLTDVAGKIFPLQMERSARPSELKGVAHNLTNGKYRIHWQVLASDGHITRGDVAFTVWAQ